MCLMENHIFLSCENWLPMSQSNCKVALFHTILHREREPTSQANVVYVAKQQKQSKREQNGLKLEVRVILSCEQ